VLVYPALADLEESSNVIDGQEIVQVRFGAAVFGVGKGGQSVGDVGHGYLICSPWP
jgi:hypothetical protein